MLVLIATDGSADATRAVKWLREFPLPSDAVLLVLVVATLAHPPRDLETVHALRESVVARAHRVGEDARKLLEGRGLRVELLVAEGDPREQIVHVAHERQVDLIVLGARGLGAVKGWLLGSVSRAVTEYAPCPVLVAKGTPRTLRCAVVAVDGSEGAREAVRFLSIFGIARDMTLRLLTVVESEQFLATTPLAGPQEAALRQRDSEHRTVADALLTAAAVELAGAAREIEQSVAEGIPAEEIVKATKRPDVELVVVGSRGLGAMKRLILGSVSGQVLHHSRCPVLVVRRR